LNPPQLVAGAPVAVSSRHWTLKLLPAGVPLITVISTSSPSATLKVK